MTRPIPWAEFDAEVALVRHLVCDVPWRRADGTDDRALRAEYRRWAVADAEPTPLMLAALWRRTPADGCPDLTEEGVDRAVHHAALVLHLVALGEGGTGQPVDNLGAACRPERAGVAEGRFARLVNTPPTARLETLGRLFRRFARKGVPYRVAAPRQAENAGAPDLRSTRATLRDDRRDDLAALLAFLFTDDPKPAASRWAAGYYKTSPLTTADAPANTPAVAPAA